MGVFKRICLAGLLTVLVTASVSAEGPALSYLETDELRLLYFHPLQTYLVPHVVRSFHNSMIFQRQMFDWEPWERTTMLLQDFSDYGNAAAGASPTNAMLIDIAPLSRTFETFTASERIFMLMNHELVHVATMDVWNRQDAVWRENLFGKVAPDQDHPESILWSYWTAPRTAVPRWYLEGSAVFMETWMGAGLGRAQGAFDEMVFRAMVRDDAHFYSNLGLVSEGTRIDFQAGVNAYLYGTRFMSYMALEHSPEKLVEWLRRGEDSKRYYAQNFKHVFGKDLEVAWDEWIAWEHEFQRANLERINEVPTTSYENLTDTALGSVSKAYVDPDNRTLIGAFRYPGVVAHVGALSIDDGSIRKLQDIKGPMLYRVTSLAYDPDSKTAFYTTDNYRFRDVMALDTVSGDARMLLKDARIGDLAFNRADKSLWGVRHLNGLATLVRMPHPHTEWSQVHSWNYGQILYDLDVSPDGTMLSASMGEVNGDQFLKIWRIEDLLAGNIEPMGEYNFGLAVPEGFVFSPDNRYLFGSSYYTGVSNIFRYEIATGDVEGVSNAVTGFFRPIPLEDGRLIVFNFTGQGFVPAMIDPVPLEDVSAVRFLGNEIVKKHPVVKEWAVGSPRKIDFEGMEKREGVFVPWKNMGLKNAYPVIMGYKDAIVFAYAMNFGDSLGLANLDLAFGFNDDSDLPGNERGHLNLKYSYMWWTLQFFYNGADFYDLFGPVERSRKGRAYLVEYVRPLIFDLPRRMDIAFDAGYFDGLERLPGNQNVNIDVEDFFSFQGELSYKHMRHSIGHVDEEKGFRWNLTAGATVTDDETVPKIRGGFDFGVPFIWKHSSLWLRSSAGWADGNLDDPFANYFFGSFQNNYVDRREIKRYREWYSMPGFEIDELFGQTFFRSMLEWNIPPIIFREVGKPSAFLTWARPALFATVLATDFDDSRIERTVYNIGGQIDFRFTIVHRLPMTFSIGYAAGFEDSTKIGDEWMFSLKIL
ncbi:MAG: hypothetical protein E2O56_01950 [Gammaproteobacteria bacterium]|nr:MAG: hypothetical protein E2O56_01950 [Gammaproteobacteria bacterium]